MTELDDYKDRYQHIRLSRSPNGILEVVIHSDGDSLRWGLTPHREMTEVFRLIALDRRNRVVIITGAGEEFLGPRADDNSGKIASQMAKLGIEEDAAMWEKEAWTDEREMTSALLDIAVPVVSAINGPVRRHNEVALLADVVIASDTASFEDSAHFDLQDLVPGDGIHVLSTMLFGVNRARAFMYTGEPMSAEEAHRYGAVAEVVPKEQVLKRAYEIAERIAEKSDSTLRFTRALLVQPIKKQFLEHLGTGLAYEGLAALGRTKRQ